MIVKFSIHAEERMKKRLNTVVDHKRKYQLSSYKYALSVQHNSDSRQQVMIFAYTGAKMMRHALFCVRSHLVKDDEFLVLTVCTYNNNNHFSAQCVRDAYEIVKK